MSDPTSSQRIVPDVEQSLGAQHYRQRRGPTLWPLWLMLLLIIALLVALSAGLWWERERLQGELNRVSGEVSNMHARLESGDTDVVDTVTYLQAQMTTLFQEQEQLSVSLGNTREELYGVLTDGDELASSEALGQLRQNVEELRQAAELNDRQLQAVRSSLSALEQAGTAGRQNLMEEMTYLGQNTAEQMAALEEQLERESASIEERFSQWRGEFDERLAEMSDIAQNDEANIDQQTLDNLTEQLSGRISALESDLRQVRQAQLAFSAQMEMLR